MERDWAAGQSPAQWATFHIGSRPASRVARYGASKVATAGMHAGSIAYVFQLDWITGPTLDPHHACCLRCMHAAGSDARHDTHLPLWQPQPQPHTRPAWQRPTRSKPPWNPTPRLICQLDLDRTPRRGGARRPSRPGARRRPPVCSGDWTVTASKCGRW